MQLLLLPPDPEAEALHIDSELWAWLEAHQSVDVGGRAIRLGDLQHPTAHAAALVRGYGRGESWSHYLALHRSGAIELGLGDRGGWERQSPEGEPMRVFNLISVVAYTWALLKFGAAANERLSLNGPWQLAVGLLRTHGAHLGNLGQGWAEPGSFENTFGGCVEPNLLWHLGIDAWPDEEGQQRLAFSIGDRLEDAWGRPSAATSTIAAIARAVWTCDESPCSGGAPEMGRIRVRTHTMLMSLTPVSSTHSPGTRETIGVQPLLQGRQATGVNHASGESGPAPRNGSGDPAVSTE